MPVLRGVNAGVLGSGDPPDFGQGVVGSRGVQGGRGRVLEGS